MEDSYDFFYKNGVPKWRGTGYYYSRFRPGLGVSADIHTSKKVLLMTWKTFPDSNGVHNYTYFRSAIYGSRHELQARPGSNRRGGHQSAFSRLGEQPYAGTGPAEGATLTLFCRQASRIHSHSHSENFHARDCRSKSISAGRRVSMKMGTRFREKWLIWSWMGLMSTL